MTQGSSTYFATDRFGNANSALALNGGWTQVPAGVYFDTPGFTISVWVYPQQIGASARVIDFGNGAYGDNVALAFSLGGGKSWYFYLDWTNYESYYVVAENVWQLLTFTFDGQNAYVYINGSIVYQQSAVYTMPVLTRTNCYIGQSNWVDYGDGYSSSLLDDLRFYSKSLSQTEIIQLMNFQSSYLSLFNNLIFSLKI